MENRLRNTGQAFQVLNSLLEVFDVGMQVCRLYSEPFFFFFFTENHLNKKRCQFYMNGSETNDCDVILHNRRTVRCWFILLVPSFVSIEAVNMKIIVFWDVIRNSFTNIPDKI